MKERPILFNSEMVRAVLDGRKTQTRRPVKIPIRVDGHTGIFDIKGNNYRVNLRNGDQSKLTQFCPFGVVGDRLWVRETCAAEELPNGFDVVRYISDCSTRKIEDSLRAAQKWVKLYNYGGKAGSTVPSIHMPRWASRINLEVTNVRVERLQDISEADAIAEGCDNSKTEAAISAGWYEKPQRAFRRLWESINGAESWESNPWVWVVEFKRIGH